MKGKIFFVSLLNTIIFYYVGFGQPGNALFRKTPFDSLGIKCYELLCTKTGAVWITTSAGIFTLKGREFSGASVSYGGAGIKNFRSYLAEDSIRSLAEAPDSMIYYVTQDNLFFCTPNGDELGIGWPPFYFPPKGQYFDRVSKTWIDTDGDLFIGTYSDNFYLVKEATDKNFASEIRDSNMIIVKGEKKVQKITLALGMGVFSFAEDISDKNIIWVGTNRGLFTYNNSTGQTDSIRSTDNNDGAVTVTHIEINKQGDVWFSTLEKGIGLYDRSAKRFQFYPYPKKQNDKENVFYPVKTFCYKSPQEYFAAIMDSLPAIFNTISRTYTYIDDPVLKKSAGGTTDVKVDKSGNLLVIKGGTLYLGNTSHDNLLGASADTGSALLAPLITGINLLNGQQVSHTGHEAEPVKEVRLNYDQNSFTVYYSVADFSADSNIHFAWKIDGFTEGWVMMPALNVEGGNFADIRDLKPGKYVLDIKVRIGNDDWRKQQTHLIIIIDPPFWQTWWFWVSIIIGTGILIFFIVKWRVNAVRKQERLTAKHEKEMLELEAKALRAQMNPHFIFNCMNSIKLLIQQKEEDKAINYLTTFSKLIRTIFQNSNKREITLYDEIENCKLYTQLESMRFENKFSYTFSIDETIDMKLLMVPALIIQPFIENAIWHGIMPKEDGGCVSVTIKRADDNVLCIIDDNGIGRETSRQNKFKSDAHESKGVHLTQSRIDLDNLINQRNASLEIVDKKDENNKEAGTRVILTFKEY